jgi:hypothetical protein
VLSQSVVESAIEVKADPDAAEHRLAEHLLDVAGMARLRQARVIMVGVVVRNVGPTDVVVRFAETRLELEDGRVLRAIPENAVDERRSESSSPLADAPPEADGGGDSGEDGRPEQLLGQLAGPIIVAVVAAVLIVTSPIWALPILITRRIRRKAEEARLRDEALQSLREVRLAEGEAAKGLLFFAYDGQPPATPLTATLVVAVRRGEAENDEHVRVRLDKTHPSDRLLPSAERLGGGEFSNEWPVNVRSEQGEFDDTKSEGSSPRGFPCAGVRGIRGCLCNSGSGEQQGGSRLYLRRRLA